jgi:hypothetical protein
MANITALQLFSLAKQNADGSTSNILVRFAALELGIDPDEEPDLIDAAIEMWDRETDASYWSGGRL